MAKEFVEKTTIKDERAFNTVALVLMLILAVYCIMPFFLMLSISLPLVFFCFCSIHFLFTTLCVLQVREHINTLTSFCQPLFLFFFYFL